MITDHVHLFMVTSVTTEVHIRLFLQQRVEIGTQTPYEFSP